MTRKESTLADECRRERGLGWTPFGNRGPLQIRLLNSFHDDLWQCRRGDRALGPHVPYMTGSIGRGIVGFVPRAVGLFEVVS